MAYADMPKFIASLRTMDGIAARALEFLIFTAARTSEVLDAKWSEIDLDATIWMVPPERLKTGKLTRRPHVVPFPIARLRSSRRWARSAPPIMSSPGSRTASRYPTWRYSCCSRSAWTYGSPHMVSGQLSRLVRRRDLVPARSGRGGLGHVVGGVEAAYRRSDALAKRRLLMDAWAAYCAPPSDTDAGNVMPFPARAQLVTIDRNGANS